MDYAAMLKASVNETMSVPEIVDAFEKCVRNRLTMI